MTDCKNTANERCGDCDACDRRRDRVATVAFYALILAAGASIGINVATIYRLAHEAPQLPAVTCPAGKTPVVNTVDGAWLVRCEVKP